MMTEQKPLRSSVLALPKVDAEAFRLLAWALSDRPKGPVADWIKMVGLACNTFKTQESCELLAFAASRDLAVTFIQLLSEERRELAMEALLADPALAAEKLAQVERVQREARRIIEEIFALRQLKWIKGGLGEKATGAVRKALHLKAV